MADGRGERLDLTAESAVTVTAAPAELITSAIVMAAAPIATVHIGRTVNIRTRVRIAVRIGRVGIWIRIHVGTRRVRVNRWPHHHAHAEVHPCAGLRSGHKEQDGDYREDWNS